MKHIRIFDSEEEFYAVYNSEEYVSPWGSAIRTPGGGPLHGVAYNKKKSPIIFDITKRDFDGVISYNFHSSDPRAKVEDDFVTFEAYLIQQQMYL